MSHLDYSSPIAGSAMRIDSGGAVRVAIYMRVSSRLQMEGFGFEAQRTNLHEYARKKGWYVVGVYEEPGISAASLSHRPSMMRMLADAAEGKFDIILCAEETRLSRAGGADWEYIEEICDENNITIATPEEVLYEPNSEMHAVTLGFKGVMSRHQRRYIARKTKEGRQQAARDGFIPSGFAAYGLKTVRTGEKRWACAKVVKVEEKAANILLIFRLCAGGRWAKEAGQEAPDGWGPSRICDFLNGRGIPGPSGGKWQDGTVRAMIANPVYRGEYISGRYACRAPKGAPRGTPKTVRVLKEDGEGIVIAVPAIVPPELWHAANAAVQARRGTTGAPATKYPAGLLNTLIFCHCGQRCVHQGTRGKRPEGAEPFRYYRCGGRKERADQGRERCAAPSLRADYVDEKVWARVEVCIAKRGEFTKAIENHREREARKLAERQKDKGLAERLQRQLAATDRAAERVREAYRREVYTLEVADRELKSIDAEATGIRAELDSLRAKEEEADRWEAIAKNAEATAAACRNNLHRMTQAEKRRLLLAFDARVDVDSLGNGWLSFAFDAEGEARLIREVGKRTTRFEDFANLPALRFVLPEPVFARADLRRAA